MDRAVGGSTDRGSVFSGHPRLTVNPPGGVLPYMGYIGMCGPKGYGF